MKMIVSDLDGTLFDSSKYNYKICENLSRAIEKFKEKGNKFTVATGRPKETTEKVARLIKVNAPYISYNGAEIIDIDGKTIHSESFSLNNILPFLVDLEEMEGISILIPCDGKMICFKKTKEIVDYEKKEYVRCIEKKDISIDKINKVKKVLIIGDVGRIVDLWNRYESSYKDNFCYIISENNYIEFVSKGVSKGVALKKLRDIVGKDIEIISVGNHLNDLEMLQESDIGYAVENAVGQLKEVADFVTERQYEKGVIEVIKKHI